MQKINPCLWFNHDADEATRLYVSLFSNASLGNVVPYTKSSSAASGQPQGSTMTIDFKLANQKILALNGGPEFKFTPALSFFVWCDTEKEILHLWDTLSKGGNIRMALGSYPWAQQYGWTTDKYGVEWQLILTSYHQKIAPAFLFVDDLFGKGEEAINYYMSIFKDSKIESITKDEKTNAVTHCLFSLAGQPFVLMEGQGSHGFTFSHAFSLMVNCETQEDIDQYSHKLSGGGEIEPCGWVKDKYGVSWQVVPSKLKELTNSNDLAKLERVMQALMQMKKIDLAALEKAAS